MKLLAFSCFGEGSRNFGAMIRDKDKWIPDSSGKSEPYYIENEIIRLNEHALSHHFKILWFVSSIFKINISI